MYSVPWAKLSTSIRPRMIEKPAATKKTTAPVEKPLKVVIIQSLVLMPPMAIKNSTTSTAKVAMRVRSLRSVAHSLFIVSSFNLYAAPR